VAKKFQVFISSTYSDLRDERQGAVEGVLLAKHIPAGMELFSAGDESQLKVIQDWIRESDIYLLILGARYGSIEPKSGRSYTEIEYDFAVASGMPHFALVLNDKAMSQKRAARLVSPEDDKTADKLASFRDKVLSKSSRLVGDPRDVQIFILQSLHEIERRPGLRGWVRPDDTENVAPLINQIGALNAENSKLKSELDAAKVKEATPNLDGLSASVSIRIQSKIDGRWYDARASISTTWRDLFAAMAIKLLAPTNDDYLSGVIACHYNGSKPESWHEYRIHPDDWETVKAKFLKLEFVDIQSLQTVSKTVALFWTLTPLGKSVGLVLRAK
jgi:hypothetical protein